MLLVYEEMVLVFASASLLGLAIYIYRMYRQTQQIPLIVI